MELLAKMIARLEKFQYETQTKGNSPDGILFETGYFLRELPEVIENLKQVQIDLQNESDSGEGRSLE